MPRYTIRCPEHGDHEVFRHITNRVFRCENGEFVNAWHPKRGRRRCYWPVEQVITASALPGVRIDCAGDDARVPERVADGTAKFNMGLPGVETVVGVRPDGKPKLAYRPMTHHEVGSNTNAREIAKRNGLEMQGEGAYRTVAR